MTLELKFLINPIFYKKIFLRPSLNEAVKSSQKSPQNHPGLLPRLLQCCGNGNSTVDPICLFFYTNFYFSARLVFSDVENSQQAPKRQVCFRSSSSAPEAVIQLRTPHCRRFGDLGESCALVLFGAHSPLARCRSWFMPRGTTRAELTTDAAILPTLRPLPSIESGRTRTGDTPEPSGLHFRC